MIDIYIKISKNDDFITLNKVLLNPSDIKLEQTYLINTEKPEVLWNLLYTMAELPIPKIPLPIEPSIPKRIIEEITEPPSIKSPEDLKKEEIEQILNSMTAKDIIDKVFKEKDIQITTDIKSKKLIIKQAVNLLA